MIGLSTHITYRNSLTGHPKSFAKGMDYGENPKKVVCTYTCICESFGGMDLLNCMQAKRLSDFHSIPHNSHRLSCISA